MTDERTRTGDGDAVEWVNPEQAAEMGGCGVQRIYRMLRAGTFPTPAYRFGGHWRIVREPYVRFLASGELP